MTSALHILNYIEQLRQQRKSFCVATVISTSGSTAAVVGTKAVIGTDGELHGFIGGGCVTGAVKRNALACLASGQPKLIRVAPKDQQDAQNMPAGMEIFISNCPSRGTADFFLEPTRAQPRLFICGSSPIAQSLLNFGKNLGHRIVVIAPQIDQSKIINADEYHEVYDFDQWALTAEDSIIIATQGKQDKLALTATLHAAAGYKGMICSHKKLANLKQKALDDSSLDEALFANLYAPAGLKIGAVLPEEIALAIIGEMVAHQRKVGGDDA